MCYDGFFKVSAESNFEKRMMADSSQARLMVSSWMFVGWCTDRFLMCTPYCTLDRRRFGMRMIGMLLSLSCLLRLSFTASCLSDSYLGLTFHTGEPPQWGAADAEIKVPSGENTELKRSAFKAWSKSVCSHTCYAYCQGFLPCLFLPFRFIHLHFFPKPLLIFHVLAVSNTWFLCRPAE